MKKILIAAAVTASFATVANAQSSVTLYGLIDAGFTYVNNEATSRVATGSAAAFRLSSGNVDGSRWGLRGVEDLGGGMKAIFTLENGFDLASGKSQQGSREFGRQAYAGLSTANMGTVTLGRQYDSMVDYVAPLTANGSWGGTYFAHPFDNDNTDNSFRVNNSVKYQSANYGGLTFGGLYGFSNEAGGFADNRAYSAGVGYSNGPLKLAAGYLQLQNSIGNQNGAVTEATVPSQTQRTFGMGGSYAFGPATVGAVWTQSRFQFVTGDASVRINNYELNGRYALTPALAVGAAYTYTDAKNMASIFPDGSNHSRYHQFGLQTDYALSKRTDIYAEGVVQLTNKESVTQVYGTNAPAAHGNQVVISTGLRHRF